MVSFRLVILEAMPNIIQKIPNFKLLVVGDGSHLLSKKTKQKN